MRATAARIQKIIDEALVAGVRLRACGSRWSFSDIPVVAGGWILETQNIDWRFTIKSEFVEAGALVDHKELILAQCGASIAQVNQDLETKNWRRALATSGASNGQTIGGALGTGIHGSAIDVGGLESQVLGIQLLTAKQNLWIERASAPALNAAFAAKLGATLVRDDEKFAAAIVSLGALGIVHSALLKTAPRYRLNSSLSHIPSAKIATAMNTLNFVGSGIPDEQRRPYFFQTIMDPRRTDIAYVTVRYRQDCPADFVPDYKLVTGSEPGTDVPKMIAAAIKTIPGIRDLIVSKLMSIELRVRADVESEWKTPGQAYTFTSAREGIASCGFAIPVAQVTRALDIARAAFQSHKSAPVVFTCRYAQKSPGILSFIGFDPTCIFDIDGVDTPATHKLIKLVAERFDAVNLPYTMHWGKTNHLTKARVRANYGGAVDRWNAVRAQLLPDAKERTMFSSPFLDGLGLNG
jgi:FAD binding domain